MSQSEKILEAARGNLLAYACATNQNYQMPKHLVEIAKILHRVESGELKRVILTIPPRHGKSLLCSTYFPAWYLGRNPEKYLITSTYGQELSDDFGRAVRNQLADPLYRAIFPKTELTKDSHSASRFSTTSGGSYFATGVGGAITGRGAHMLLIDDPIKNRKDAESPTIRRKLQEWYSSVAYTRLMPGGSIFVIGTRWHQDDLIGYLLREQSHENWTIINLKAIDEDGSALWPEAYPLEVLDSIRRVNAYDWAALYQQEPISKDTQVLSYDKITGYSVLPKLRFIATACDPAISKDSKACNTSFTTVGFGEDGHYYDLETIADKWSFFETLEQAKRIISRHRVNYLGVEAVGYQRALSEACQKYFNDVIVVDLKADTDKFRRAKSISHIIDQGLFHTNNRELMDEIANFDPLATGSYKKDRVDSLVHALHMVQVYAPMITEPQLHEEHDLKDLNPFQQIFVRCERQEKARALGEQRVVNYDNSPANVDPDFF